MNPSPDKQELKPTVSYGNYFLALRKFLDKKRLEKLTGGINRSDNSGVDVEDIRKIHIVFEKHGAFYHPSRVIIIFRTGISRSFAVNVAVSEIGREAILNEYHHLDHLNRFFPRSFVPQVYALDEFTTAEGADVKMFVGEWFEGFHEFHMSQNGMCVWHPENGGQALSEQQAREVFYQVAFILSYYYNLETFEHIFPWHHAAGDFVVSTGEKDLHVKMITVRQYQPLMPNDSPDPLMIVQAMMAFLLNLSIRMRIDRMAGVGDYVWSGDFCVDATLEGFFTALDHKDPINVIPGIPSKWAKEFLSLAELKDWEILAETLLGAYSAGSPEIALIKNNLDNHLKSLYIAVSSR